MTSSLSTWTTCPHQTSFSFEASGCDRCKSKASTSGRPAFGWTRREIASAFVDWHKALGAFLLNNQHLRVVQRAVFRSEITLLLMFSRWKLKPCGFLPNKRACLSLAVRWQSKHPVQQSCLCWLCKDPNHLDWHWRRRQQHVRTLESTRKMESQMVFGDSWLKTCKAKSWCAMCFWKEIWTCKTLQMFAAWLAVPFAISPSNCARDQRLRSLTPKRTGPRRGQERGQEREEGRTKSEMFTSSNKKLLGTSASLLVTGALLVVTRSY